MAKIKKIGPNRNAKISTHRKERRKTFGGKNSLRSCNGST